MSRLRVHYEYFSSAGRTIKHTFSLKGNTTCREQSTATVASKQCTHTISIYELYQFTPHPNNTTNDTKRTKLIATNFDR